MQQSQQKVAVLAQVNALIEADLFESADVLCSLFASSFHSPGFFELIEIQGDICMKRRETRRALSYYLEASELTKGAADTLHLKISQCHLELRDTAAALRELRKVSSKNRSAKTLLTLGHLYRMSGARELALAAYLDALRLLPFCTEVLEHVLHLGVDGAVLLAVVEKSSTGSASWPSLLARAMLYRRDCDFSRCLETLKTLQSQCPNNAYVLSLHGACLAQLEMADLALGMYQRVRAASPLYVGALDEHAYLLFGMKSGDAELNKLAIDAMALFECGQGKPWAVAALCCERRGDPDKALTFIDNAIRANPLHAFFYRLKGLLLLSRGHNEEAIVALRQSNGLRREVETYAGLAKAHLDLGQAKDASLCAKEALQLAPKSPLALLLMAKILEKSPQKASECLRLYNEALRVNPSSSTCAIGKAELLVSLDRKQEAIDVLRATLEINPCQPVRLILGKICSVSGFYGEAMEELQYCVTPSGTESAAALEEIDRLEALINSAGDGRDRDSDDFDDAGSYYDTDPGDYAEM